MNLSEFIGPWATIGDIYAATATPEWFHAHYVLGDVIDGRKIITRSASGRYSTWNVLPDATVAAMSAPDEYASSDEARYALGSQDVLHLYGRHDGVPYIVPVVAAKEPYYGL